MDPILMLLDKNARMSDEQIAVALGMTAEQVREKIHDYEKRGIIKGYRALVDWEKTDRNYVSAQIEVKILLNGKLGFDDIADKLSQFEEVQTVSLMSGAYDVALTVTGKTFQEIAMFVASRLSPLEGVQSTSTSFLLKNYKECGVMSKKEEDIREVRG